MPVAFIAWSRSAADRPNARQANSSAGGQPPRETQHKRIAGSWCPPDTHYHDSDQSEQAARPRGRPTAARRATGTRHTPHPPSTTGLPILDEAPWGRGV
jgi:hypothetical protein